MRLVDWPRMPYLNDEVKDWIRLELKNLGVEDLAVYAIEAGREGDERRVIVATEVGLLDHRYAPFGSSARYRLAMLLYPWQTLRGVELRADTFRLWAREHRTRWSLKLAFPPFEAATENPDLGAALCALARVCAVMAEPFGVPAGRANHDDHESHGVRFDPEAGREAEAEGPGAGRRPVAMAAAPATEPVAAEAETAPDADAVPAADAAAGPTAEPEAAAAQKKAAPEDEEPLEEVIGYTGEPPDAASVGEPASDDRS